MKHAKSLQKGFTLIELLIVVVVIGILLLLTAPSLKSISSGATSKQIYDFAHTADANWKLINLKCGTTSATATSPVVSTPSAIRSLGLIVTGSTFLNATYTGCWNEAGVKALHTKATGNITDGFKVAGYTVTWSGGGTTPVSFVITGVPVETALLLYNQYSSASGAQTATAIPAVADATDPMFRFTAPGATGMTTITLLFE